MISNSPLRHLRVVEMTEALAGPYCSMLLGDLGADVIKVERRGQGDQSRGWGPPFLHGESAYYLSVNRNKRSLELDLKDAREQGLLLELLATADVFITNVPRMASLKRLGIDPETLHERNPRLVYAAISGYGHTGPKASRGCYDIIAQGEAGLMAITGDETTGPTRFPTPMADITAGIYTVIGILAALYTRDEPTTGTGRGQFLDVSLVDAQTTWLANLAGSYFATGERPRPLGNIHPTVTPYQPLRARDKMVIVAVGTERLWRRFCETLEIEHTIMGDPRFATNADRNMNREQLIPWLKRNWRQQTPPIGWNAWSTAGFRRVPSTCPTTRSPTNRFLARGMVVELEHPLIGSIKSLGNPINLSETGPSYRRYPPRLGEHNAEILAELVACREKK